MPIILPKFSVQSVIPLSSLTLNGPVLTKGILSSSFPRCWEQNYTGKDILVAIVDTGIDGNHPDLKGKVVKQINLTSEKINSIHGTHVAGIIAANGLIKGGAPNCSILDIKIISSTGGSVDNLIKAINLSVINNAHVINVSLGSSDLTPEQISRLQTVVNNAWNSGVICVAASGNEGKSLCTVDGYEYPASIKKAESVGCCDVGTNLNNIQLSIFSNENDMVDITACGVNILSTSLNNSYAILSGTSMSTPHVSAMVANLYQCVKEKYPTLSGSSLSSTVISLLNTNILKISGCRIGPVNSDISYGLGFLRYDNSLDPILPSNTKYFYNNIFLGYNNI